MSQHPVRTRELINAVAAKTGVRREIIRNVIHAFLDEAALHMSEGRAVNIGRVVRLRLGPPKGNPPMRRVRILTLPLLAALRRLRSGG